jgi:hypothetical protein
LGPNFADFSANVTLIHVLLMYRRTAISNHD